MISGLFRPQARLTSKSDALAGARSGQTVILRPPSFARGSAELSNVRVSTTKIAPRLWMATATKAPPPAYNNILPAVQSAPT